MNDSGRGDLYYLIFLFLYDKPQSNQTNESGVTIPTIHSLESVTLTCLSQICLLGGKQEI